jgi:hypothetical protein
MIQERYWARNSVLNWVNGEPRMNDFGSVFEDGDLAGLR